MQRLKICQVAQRNSHGPHIDLIPVEGRQLLKQRDALRGVSGARRAAARPPRRASSSPSELQKQQNHGMKELAELVTPRQSSPSRAGAVRRKSPSRDPSPGRRESLEHQRRSPMRSEAFRRKSPSQDRTSPRTSPDHRTPLSAMSASRSTDSAVTPRPAPNRVARGLKTRRSLKDTLYHFIRSPGASVEGRHTQEEPMASTLVYHTQRTRT